MCGSSTSCDKTKVQKVEGKWSTIYDQAIKVELNNGMRFISNFRYQAKKELSKDPLNDPMLMMADIHSGDYGSFDSKCDQTMVGFVQQSTQPSTMETHNVVCFYGKQDKQNLIEKTYEIENSTQKIAKIISH